MGRGAASGAVAVAGGKARAVLKGRPAVSLDDIRAVALPVLRHRILVISRRKRMHRRRASRVAIADDL
jgi:Mg-chelatase subunit ChlI